MALVLGVQGLESWFYFGFQSSPSRRGAHSEDSKWQVARHGDELWVAFAGGLRGPDPRRHTQKDLCSVFCVWCS